MSDKIICTIPLDDLEQQMMLEHLPDMIKELMAMCGRDIEDFKGIKTETVIVVSIDDELEPPQMALKLYNEQREKQGLMPLHKLPLGTKFSPSGSGSLGDCINGTLE